MVRRQQRRWKPFKEAIAQYRNGLVDYNRVVVIQERLVQRQQTLAESEGQIAQGLIQVYRSLGGGWQIRCEPEAAADSGPNSTHRIPAGEDVADARKTIDAEAAGAACPIAEGRSTAACSIAEGRSRAPGRYADYADIGRCISSRDAPPAPRQHRPPIQRKRINTPRPMT